MWRSCSIKIRALKTILSSSSQMSAPFLKCYKTLSPQAVFLSLQFPYSVIIRTNAAGLLSFCLLYCIHGMLHVLSTINPIPCHILSDPLGSVTSAPACHTSCKSTPRDPSSLQHFYLLLMLWPTLTCQCGNMSSWGSMKINNFWIHSQLCLQQR